MTLLNFDTIIKDLNGVDMRELVKEGEEPRFATMRSVCLSALLVPQQGDDHLDGKKKFELVDLAFKIKPSEDVDLTHEEIALLKQRIAKVPFDTYIVNYRVQQFLENKE